MHPCSRGQLPSGLHKQDCSQQAQENGPHPQFNTSKTTEPGLPLTKRHEHPGGCPPQAAVSVMGLEHKIDKGKLRGQTQSGEKRAQGDHIAVCNYLT